MIGIGRSYCCHGMCENIVHVDYDCYCSKEMSGWYSYLGMGTVERLHSLLVSIMIL